MDLDLSKRPEAFVLGYDNIIQVPDVHIVNKIIRSNPTLSKYFRQDILTMDECDAANEIATRDDKNLIRWMMVEKDYDDAYYKRTYDTFYNMNNHMYDESPITSFINGIREFSSSDYFNGIHIILNGSDERKIKVLDSILEGISFTVHDVEPNKVAEYVYENISDYTVFAYDSVEELNKLLELDKHCVGKSYALPDTKYNYESDNINNVTGIRLPKDNIYENCVTKHATYVGIDIGFFKDAYIYG